LSSPSNFELKAGSICESGSGVENCLTEALRLFRVPVLAPFVVDRPADVFGIDFLLAFDIGDMTSNTRMDVAILKLIEVVH
jgi:hypothetical protein